MENEKTFLKLKNASSNGEQQQQQPPMGDASFNQDQNIDNSMENGQDVMGTEPGMNTMMDNPEMDNAGQPPMENEPNIPEEGTEDDTMSIINQLSDDDKEAVRAYAESMLKRDETANNEEMPQNEEQPMMEQVIFTKKQIKKIHENFGPTQDVLDKDSENREESLVKKTTKTTSNKSPFNPKKFN